MAYDSDSLVNMQILMDMLKRTKKEYLEAILKSGHASIVEVDVVPTPEEAEDGIMYLIRDEEGHGDIYSLVGGEVIHLDDTSADLKNYVTVEELQDVIKSETTLEVFSSYDSALQYAKTDPNAYVGEIISVVEDGVTTCYTVTEEGTLKEVGGVSEEDVASEDEVTQMLDEVFA